MTGDPVSLYIHVPFCTKKCPYCHFFVLPDSEEGKALFLKSLHQEYELRRPLLEGKTLVSIYFGGGTPSLLHPREIEALIQKIYQSPLSMAPSCEITLEANPEQVSLQLMKQFAKAGINRVSLGVQSFDDLLLKTLGRTHDVAKAKRAIDAVYEAGICNISIDLMYELPHQTLLQWEHSLQQVALLPITHLSLYNLVFELGTVFYKKKKLLDRSLPSEEESLAMLTLAVERLEHLGLKRYEISAFAKEGFASVHNSGYWTARPFLGLGPSAFSYLEGRRFRNVAHLGRYAESLEKGMICEDFEETLSPSSRQKELLAVELRLLRGVDLSQFQQKLGPLSSSLQSSIRSLGQKGWLTQQGDRLFLTEEGLLFYDSVAAEIV